MSSICNQICAASTSKHCRDFVSGGRYIGTQRNWSNIGIRCYDSLATYTGFNTINPPNGGSCTPTSNPWGEGEGIYTASSYHVGGAHVISFDGSVRFFVDEVDTLSSSPPALADGYYSPARQQINGRWTETPNWKSESPFGFWGGLGTRASNDWELGLHQ
jgi:hypothetical protein